MSSPRSRSAAAQAPIVVDKFGGSVLRGPTDIAAAVDVVARQRAAGLRPVVVVSAFEGVTDTILSVASALFPDEGRVLHQPSHSQPSAPARETDRALVTGELLSAALLALGLQARGIAARSFSGAEAGIRIAATHRGAEVQRVHARRLRQALADGMVPVVAGFQGMGKHGELTTLERGGSDLSAVVLTLALGADGCELFKDTGAIMEADPHLVPGARLLEAVDAIHLELHAQLGAEIIHPVALRRARRGGLPLVVRAFDDGAPQTVVRPRFGRASRSGKGPRRTDDEGVVIAGGRPQGARVARISLVGPAARMPERLALPADGNGSFTKGGMRIVWAAVAVAKAAPAARAVHATACGIRGPAGDGAPSWCERAAYFE
jgi:aspartate kinase